MKRSELVAGIEARAFAQVEKRTPFDFKKEAQRAARMALTLADLDEAIAYYRDRTGKPPAELRVSAEAYRQLEAEAVHLMRVNQMSLINRVFTYKGVKIVSVPDFEGSGDTSVSRKSPLCMRLNASNVFGNAAGGGSGQVLRSMLADFDGVGLA